MPASQGFFRNRGFGQYEICFENEKSWQHMQGLRQSSNVTLGSRAKPKGAAHSVAGLVPAQSRPNRERARQTRP